VRACPRSRRAARLTARARKGCNRVKGRPVWVSAPGFRGRKRVTFQFPTDGSEPSEQVALERTDLAHRARPRRPEEGRVSILPQHQDAQGAVGHRARDRIVQWPEPPQRPDGSYLFPGVTRGRWRVLDERSGASSEPIEVVGVSAPVEVSLDLSRSNGPAVASSWTTPPSWRASDIRVLDSASGADKELGDRGASRPRGRTHATERSASRCQGTARSRSLPGNPWLVPDPEQGSIVLRGGKENLVLRLVAGDELRIPLANVNSYVRAIPRRSLCRRADRQGLGVAPRPAPRRCRAVSRSPRERDALDRPDRGLRAARLARRLGRWRHRAPTRRVRPRIVSARIRILVPKDQSTPRIAVFRIVPRRTGVRARHETPTARRWPCSAASRPGASS
jgi:hypothetical protein